MTVLERLAEAITAEAKRRVEREFEGFDLPHEMWQGQVEYEEDSIIDSMIGHARDKQE